MKRVIGIGGVFFKAENPKALNEWYTKHLGFDINEYGTIFNCSKTYDESEATAWNIFKSDTKYFDPSKKEFMINYRVENLAWLVEQLKNEGVTILDEIEEYEYGKFIHILDPENNKIELWEAKPF